MPTSRLLALALLVLPAVAVAEPIRVTGALVGMDRGSVPDARVELYPVWESYEDALRRLAAGKREPEPLATARVDEHGQFEITAPEDGVFRLVARGEGCVPFEIPLLPLTEDTAVPMLPLLKAMPLEARTLAPDGSPLAGVEVQIDSTGDWSLWSPGGEDDLAQWRIASQAVSGQDGRLVFPGHDFGSLRLTATSPGFVGQTIVVNRRGRMGPPAVFALKPRKVRIEVRDGGGKPVPRALVRWEGRPIAVTGPNGRLEIAVPDGEAPLVVESREGWRARIVVPAASGIVPVRLGPHRKTAGKVTEAGTGRPVAGALVWSGWPMGGPATRADRDGAFQVDLPLGEAWLAASAASFFPGDRQPASQSSTVLKLEPAATLGGRVVDSAGQPVAGVWITANTSSRTRRQPGVRSRDDGSFRLTGLLYGGFYELTAVRSGFGRTKTPAKTASRGKTSPAVTIVLSDGQTAFGRVVDATGQPVEGAEVELLSFSLEREEARSVSGPDGRFELRRLSPGRATLMAEHPDYAPATVPRIEIPEETPRVDLGAVTLAASGAIEGQVTDTRGRPLEGAQVGVFPAESPGMAHWMFMHRGPSDDLKTGPDGSFRAERLQSGTRFNLTVQHPGYVVAETPGVLVPTEEPVRIEMKAAHTLSGQVVNAEGEPVREAALTRIEVLGNSRRTGLLGSTDAEGRFQITGLPSGPVDLSVTAEGYVARRLKAIQIPEIGEAEELRVVLDRGAFLEVRVTDAEGQPVPGASLSAEPETRPDPVAGQELFFMDRRSNRTDSQGRGRLQVAGPGSYTVRASNRNRSASAKVTAGPGITAVELRLPAGVEVSGRVLSAEGAPAVGARVHFRLGDRGGPLVPVEADGSFRREGVSEGSYQLVAQDSDGRSSRPLDLRVAGGPIAGLELVIDQESQRTTLSGRISGPPPEALRGIQIFVHASSPPYGFHSTETGANGEYRLEGLEPGEWTVQARSSHGEAQKTVRLEPGVPMVQDLEIAPGLTLAGSVLLDGKPVPGAQIRVWDGQGRGGEAGTAHDGKFTVRGLRPGPKTVLITGSQGIGGSWTVDLRESRDLLFEISTGRLRGRIVSETGEPVEDTEVAIEGLVPRLETAFPTPGARSGADGAFEVRLGAGRYKVQVRKEGFAPVETMVEVPPGGERAVEIRLQPLAQP